MITSAGSSNTTLGEKIRRWGRDKIFMRMAAMSPCTNWPNYLYKCTNTHRSAGCILALKYWCLGRAEISVCGCRLVYRFLSHYLQPNYLISGAFLLTVLGLGWRMPFATSWRSVVQTMGEEALSYIQAVVYACLGWDIAPGRPVDVGAAFQYRKGGSKKEVNRLFYQCLLDCLSCLLGQDKGK